ncbi:alpha/beta hydrolase-fold protein [Demequina sp. B12]|uniref:alpha/beta hydrolase n=1 Tax=Demequina sp. B12 TaxID=2992757 RepID=UPI00237C369B|nr:alpha/beta hydrolase-fold protein [Demequina sp. B12]MDE0573890.1 alpha/beta hydrolase-fold protein [Demequina sp. B12]
MAQITCRYFSDVLGMSMTATVILPQAVNQQIGMASAPARAALPTLYLLHGLSDDDSVWLRRTSIERYVADRSLAVVMPNVHRSFYSNQVDGYPYFTHLIDELPRIMGGFFPLSSRREDTFIAGLSMGGSRSIQSSTEQTPPVRSRSVVVGRTRRSQLPRMDR